MIAAPFALKTPSRTVAFRDCSPAMQHSEYLAVQRGLVAVADMIRRIAKDSVSAAKATTGSADQSMASGSGNDILAIADQDLISIAHQGDQTEQQHLGNTSEEHQGQGMTSSSARHQDSEDSHTLLDSMVEVQQKIRFL